MRPRAGHFPPPTASAAQRLRPWLMPLLAVLVAVVLFTGGGFDAREVREALAGGDPDAALHLLATAPAEDLPQAVRGLHWWTRGRRREALAALVTRPEPDLLEAPGLPTVVEPLGRWLEPPTELRLREPAAAPLHVELRNLTLNLPVAARTLPAGVSALPLDETLLPGTSCAVALREGGPEGALVALAAFELAGPDEAQAIGATLQAARELGGPGTPGAALLEANAALECGLTGHALELLRALQAAPATPPELARAARELQALTLEAQGLDASARALLAPD